MQHPLLDQKQRLHTLGNLQFAPCLSASCFMKSDESLSCLSNRRLPGTQIKETPTSLNFAFPIENHRAKDEAPLISVDVRATACMPSTSFIRFTFPLDLRLVTINSVVPIDEHTTVIRFCQMRNFARTPLVDPIIRKYDLHFQL